MDAATQCRRPEGVSNRVKRLRISPNAYGSAGAAKCMDARERPLSAAHSAARELEGINYRRGGRVVEGAGLESVYTLIAYRGFESLSLRQIENPAFAGFFI